MQLKLKIRGRVTTVGTYDWCMGVLLYRWGWVPMRFVNLLQVELEAV